MAGEEKRLTSEEKAAIIANIADIDRQLAEMEENPEKSNDFSHLNHLNQSGEKSNSAIFATFAPLVQNQKKSLPEFPVNSFPDVIRQYVEAVTESLQVPIDMVASMILSGMSLCIQGKYWLNVKAGWTESLNLYVVVVGRPSERKSPVLKEVMQPIYNYVREENEKRKPQIAEYELKKKIIIGRLKNVQEYLVKNSDSSKYTMQDAVDCQKELQELEEIRPMRLVSDDVTPEALVNVMEENNERMGIISAEGGLFGMLAGRYSSHTNLDIFLKAYSAEPYSTVRVGREGVDLKQPLLTIGLAVQPKILLDIMDNEDFRGRGLLARFLYSLPESRIGGRTYRSKAVDASIYTSYEKLCKELLNIPDLTGFVERIIKMSPEADKLAEEFFLWIEQRLSDELEIIEDWAGKLHGNTMRIAGILHVVKHGLNAVNVLVEEESMKSAITIGKYYLEHSKAAFDSMGLMETQDIKDAKYIISRLVANSKNSNNSKNEFISKRDLFDLCKGHLKTVAEMEPGLQCLVEHGYISVVKESQGKGRPSERIYINPEYFKWRESNMQRVTKMI